MTRILLVKTSSLGDVVHNLPVVADLQRHVPGAQIDWVAEETFTAIPRMHPGVSEVIPVALRRWRRELLRASTREEGRAFLRRLRATEYEAVIDTQGLLKSAMVARAARGVRHGLDWQSSREPLRLFYDYTFHVPWGQHAVARNRDLVAQALGYTLDSPADYGIRAPQRRLDWLPSGRYAVLLHATSAEAKLWPESDWVGLYNNMILNNIIFILPWGSPREQARSQRLAKAMPRAIVPPALPLEDMAAMLARASVVIGVDTGLTHLAAALNVPTVGIYGATDPTATGVYGCALAVNLGGIGAAPTVEQVIAAVEQLRVCD